MKSMGRRHNKSNVKLSRKNKTHKKSSIKRTRSNKYTRMRRRKNRSEFYKIFGQHWNVLFSSIPDRNFTYTEEIKSFFMSVESNIAPSISGKDGLQVVNIVENIKQSSSENSVVFCQK